MPQKANYGIDAPDVQRRFLLLAIILIVAGIVFIRALPKVIPPGLAIGLGIACLWTGGWFLLVVGAMFWGSKVGKLRLRDRVIGRIPWRGDEVVLDVGCGHGLMLLGAARRLSTGKAFGIDIWQQEDQAANSMQATLENARREGVEQRVDLRDGDARRIPFPDNQFDVVVSSWALHNIYDAAGRETALREIIRVLKPGGNLAIVDIRHASDYARVLREAGMEQVTRHGPSFVFVIPSYTVTAVKRAPLQGSSRVPSS
jgi:arsenite methyltransferase